MRGNPALQLHVRPFATRWGPFTPWCGPYIPWGDGLHRLCRQVTGMCVVWASVVLLWRPYPDSSIVRHGHQHTRQHWVPMYTVHRSTVTLQHGDGQLTFYVPYMNLVVYTHIRTGIGTCHGQTWWSQVRHKSVKLDEKSKLSLAKLSINHKNNQ